MSVKLIEAQPAGDVVSAETALACLFRLGAQNGVYAEIGAVRRRQPDRGRHPARSAACRAGRQNSDCAPSACGSIGKACGARRSATRSCCCSTTRTPSCWSGCGATGRKKSRSPTRCSAMASHSSLRARIWSAPGAARAASITPLPPSKADTAFGFSWFTTQAVCRAPPDARHRRRGIDDAPDRVVGADLLSAACRQGGAEPGLLDPLRAQRRGRRADPVRCRLQLSAQLSARFHHAPPRPPGRQQHDRASAAIADRLFPRQPVRRHRL